jgi:hypothetical protein
MAGVARQDAHLRLKQPLIACDARRTREILRSA